MNSHSGANRFITNSNRVKAPVKHSVHVTQYGLVAHKCVSELSLVLLMDCDLFGAKPLLVQMQINCLFDAWEEAAVEF